MMKMTARVRICLGTILISKNKYFHVIGTTMKMMPLIDMILRQLMAKNMMLLMLKRDSWLRLNYEEEIEKKLDFTGICQLHS